MLGGSVIGFALLAPLALARGWAAAAPGEKAGAAEQHAVEWVSWVSLSIMITDSLTSLAVLLIRYAAAALVARRHRRRTRQQWQHAAWRQRGLQRQGAHRWQIGRASCRER